MSFAIRFIPAVVSAVLLSLSYSAFAQPSGTNGVAPGHARPAQPTPGAPAAPMPGMTGQPMPGLGGHSMPEMAGQPRSGDGSAGQAAPPPGGVCQRLPEGRWPFSMIGRP